MSEIRINKTRVDGLLEVSVSNSPNQIEEIINEVNKYYNSIIGEEVIFQKKESSNSWWVRSPKGYHGMVNIRLSHRDHRYWNLEFNPFENNAQKTADNFIKYYEKQLKEKLK